MTFNPYILDALILILTAVLVVSFFRYFKISSIVGYLIAGVIIGPSAFGIAHESSSFHLLAEFGVVFLLFTIGLKMPLRRFQGLKNYVLGVGAAQVIFTAIIFIMLAYSFSIPINGAVIIGSGLALSSTAIGIQLLSDNSELNTKYGRISFAVLLAQDLAVVVLLTLLSTLRHSDQSITHALGLAAVKAAVVLAAIVLIGQLILRPVYRLIASLKSPELFLAVTLLVVLTTSLLTDAAGLSKELGAFIAGLLLSETEYRHQIEADIQPFYSLLLGIYFITVGFNIDVHIFMNQTPSILALLLMLLTVKSTVIFGVFKLFKLHSYTTIRSLGILVGGGEFVFVLLIPAVNQQLVDPGTAQIVYIAVALSMTITPFLYELCHKFALKFSQLPGYSVHSTTNEQDDLKKHFIICGYGRVGKLVAQLLTERHIPYVIIDNDMNRVSEGRLLNLPVYYGDATRDSVLKSLQADKAVGVLISLHFPKACYRSALMIKRRYPNLNIITRFNHKIYAEKLRQAHITHITPEHIEPSVKLAHYIFKAFNVDEMDARNFIDEFHKSHATNWLENPAPQGIHIS